MPADPVQAAKWHILAAQAHADPMLDDFAPASRRTAPGCPDRRRQRPSG